MHTPATPHHQWLKRLVGEWSVVSQASMGPGQPPMKSRGRETVRMVGDLWLVAEMVAEWPCPPTPESPTPGSPDPRDQANASPAPGNPPPPVAMTTMRAIMTIGYDPGRARYVGSWIGSPTPTMFVYEGELQAAPAGGASHVVPLNTTGPSFIDPSRTAKYQDIIEFYPAPGTDPGDPSPCTGDRRVLRSQTQGDDGAWHPFMRAEYTRLL